MMKRTVRRIGLVLLAVVFLLTLAGFIAIRWYLAPFVKQELQAGVAKSSNGLYALSLNKLRINLFTGTVRAQNLAITTDTARWATLCREQPAQKPRKIDLQIKSAGIIQLRWWRYWKTRHLELDRIVLGSPELEVTALQDSLPERAPETDTLAIGLLDRLPRLLAPHAKSLKINLIMVKNGRFLLINQNSETTITQSAEQIDWALSGIQVSDTVRIGRTLYADNIELDLHNYRRWATGRRYLLQIGQARLTGKDSLLEMTDCSMRSVGADSITFPEPRLRQPKIYFTIPETAVQGFDLFRALHRDEWNARSVRLDGAYVSLFNNMDLPLPLHRKMPNELWRSLQPRVHIDSLVVRNADIFYHEKTDDEKGKMNFRNARVLVVNLSNDTARMTDTTPVRVYASAQFMGTGDLSVALSIPLLSPNFYCHYQATLLNMPFAGINALIEAKNNVRIDEGFADEITVAAQATNGITRGSIKIYFHGLKISVLKEDSRDKKHLASAIANLVIRDNSTDKKEDRSFRTADIAYQREAADGFLRLLWRAAQSGLVNTLTKIKVEPPINDGRDKKEQQKKARKREKGK